MTSVLPEAESKVTSMKQKLNDLRRKEEARSFLSFSRENLSISQSDIEQGFSKYRMQPWRNTILCLLALFLSLVCLGVEISRFHYTTVNTREIEDLKRTVESLKHRLLKEDLLDELKAFEEQLYAESNDDDPSETDIDNMDYESNYDEENFSSHDYSSDYQDIPKYGAKPSDFPDSTIAPVPTPPELSTNKAIVEELLAAVRKVETKQELKKSHRHDDRQEKEYNELKNNTENLTISKSKRSIEESHGSKRVNNRRQARIKMRRMRNASSTSWDTLEDRSELGQNKSSRYPPKKYTHSAKRTVDSVNANGELNLKSMVGNRTKRVPHQMQKQAHRTQDTVAFHFHGNVEARGIESHQNGKIRHTSSVFTAWKQSDWVSEFNMNRHFVLAEDGRLTVNTAGLYLVYGQIHYYDDSEQLGFHIEVNNKPILKCVLDNSIGQRNISQTCYSAQVIPLKGNDIIVFKEITFTRIVIFNKLNSFFGLVKLGELPNN
ncbi:protein eiger [Ceratina calcarata]|uniref:Protein eiger n=1 Tax=Ceratina calcarata TaxID=156304 RepID=A0AAJ7SAK3_9HYME|nr:protein eiger [Ceratina calcarata]XP_026674552.1 protein eiger [Ceratina calcarata]XP_026674553.1 protein eiger [Ceratina calcarata]